MKPLNSNDIGPVLWSTPVAAAKWATGIVGMVMLAIGIWCAWDLETSGTIYVRNVGRLSAGNFVWGYRFVVAVLLAMAAVLTSAWYWFPKVTVGEYGLRLSDGRIVRWSSDLRCEQVYPGKWAFLQADERVEMIVYDALSIKRMKAELERRGVAGEATSISGPAS
ncbi:hypothetical protein SH528x_000435 [Novipirellula sp. SH528]|uniref:hypothetical protein n=1 Tax=Novipirellula sp. SH528 TaxID=3454466 RepID=UPI003F9F6EED